MPDDVDEMFFGPKPRLWEIEGSRDFFHWSVGIKLEIPRGSKHTFHRWILKVRVLCFGVELRRMNEKRVPKPPTTGTTINIARPE